MMFDDNPPPFPSSATNSDKSVDVIFADLDDNNRLTAVADDDHFTLDDSDNSCSGAAEDVGEINNSHKPYSDTDNPLRNSTLLEQEGTVSKEKEVHDSCVKADSNELSAPSTEAICSEKTGGSEDSVDSEVAVNSQNSNSVSLPVPLTNLNVSQNENESIFECPYSLFVEKVCNNDKDSDGTCAPECLPDHCLSEEDNAMLKLNTNVIEPSDVKSEFIEIKSSLATDETSSEHSVEVLNVHDVPISHDSTDVISSNFHKPIEEVNANPEVETVGTLNTETEDLDDEFGDFTESCAAVESEGTEIIDSAKLPAQEMTSGSEEWIADFENINTHNMDKYNTLTNNKEDLCNLNDFFNGDFWPSNTLFKCSEEAATSSNVSDLMEQMNTVLARKDSLNAFEAVWLAVSIVEEALALKFQWSSSAVYHHFLNSLNIDPKSTAVERVNGLPIFARQLNEATVLQPVSSAVESNKQKWDNSHGSVTTPDSTNSSDSHSFTKRAPGSNAPKLENVPFDSLAVPPVKFDWKNSGLTNPLSSGSISTSSALLDLDCLTTNDPSLAAGKPGANDVSTTLQKDLAALGIEVSATSNANDSLNANGSNKKPSLFEQIMKSEPVEHHYLSRNELSLDARALHDQLPDLDYMLSNVLLFSVTDRT